MFARFQERQDRIDGRHTRGESKSRTAAFHRRDVSLDGKARRVLRTRVLEPFVHAERFLYVGGCLIDRRDDGAGRCVGFLTGV